MIPSRDSRWRRYGPDLLVAVLLGVVAFLARRHGLPTDGLWHDDAAPGAGVKEVSSLSQLLAVGAEHPGFIAALIGWSHLGGGSDAGLTYPALTAGTLSPPLLYLALRRCGYERSISALLGAVLAAAQTDIVYSGRVRTYTIDLLIVLALAMIVPRLTRMRWRWQTGVAWFAAVAVVASFSGFALVAVGVAAAIVVLHPRSDLRVRVPAVGAQAAACVALLVAEGRTYNLPEVRDLYHRIWDAYPTFHPNPFRFGGGLLVHLRRLAETFLGGPGWFATLCILVALIGLAITAWNGRQAIRSRYLLLVFFVALMGGVLGRLPFGPAQESPLSDGGRVSLWLIPVLAVGLAAFLQGMRALLADRRTLRIVFDTAAYLVTAAILVSAVTANQLQYPFPGAKSATDFVESQLGQRDALLIGYHAHWSFAAESNFASTVDSIPDAPVGFQPDFSDPRVHYLDVGRHAERGLGPELVDPRHVAGAVKHADRVFVYYAMPLVEVPEMGARTKLSSTLRILGFEQQRTATFQDARVEIWRRGAAAGHKANPKPAAAGHRTNLRLSDLRPGWRTASTLPIPALPTCLHVPTAKTTQRAVKVTGPKAKRSAVVEVTLWPSPAAAQGAFNALRGPDATRCIQSTLQSLLLSGGYPASVTAKEVPPPPTGGDPAVAYAETVRASNGTSHFDGTVVFFTHRKASVLISGISVGGPFPSHLLSSLVATVTARVNAATPGSR